MAISIVREERPYRLITDGDGHYTVVEARCGHVYSLHCHPDCHPSRQGADDTPEGMAAVAEDWYDRDEAERRFQYMVGCEEYYSQIIW